MIFVLGLGIWRESFRSSDFHNNRSEGALDGKADSLYVGI